LPPPIGRHTTAFGVRESTRAGAQPPSSDGSHTQSLESTVLSSADMSSTGFSHETASVSTLW